MPNVATGLFQVTYIDERPPEHVKVRPRAVLEIERRWPSRLPDMSDFMPAMEGMLYGVWVGLGKPGEFEEWVDTVDEIEAIQVDDLTPSSPAPGDGS